ncbi:MAG: hypothetical protein WBI82_10940 [Sphaerochaeta sp.]
MPPFPPRGAGYLTLLSRHSLGNGTMVMLPLLSLRWGMSEHGTSLPKTHLNPHCLHSDHPKDNTVTKYIPDTLEEAYSGHQQRRSKTDHRGP